MATSQRTTGTKAGRSAGIGYRDRQDFGLLLRNHRQGMRAFAFCDSLVVYSTKSGTRSRKGRAQSLATSSCFASTIPTLCLRLWIVRFGKIQNAL